MGLEFLQRVTKTSIISGFVVALVLGSYLGRAEGLGFLAGGAWSLVNLIVIRKLVWLVCAEPTTRRRAIVTVATVKVPVLYALGFLLLSSGLPIPALLAGFMWPLLVIVLKSLARMIFGFEQRLARQNTLRTPKP